MNERKNIHQPVLLQEVIEYLDLKPGYCFIDATLDGGGHTRAVLERYPDAKILGIEIDAAEVASLVENYPDIKERITIVNNSYTHLQDIVQQHNIRPDGILFDLGLSSWHFEASGRGFSFQKDELLDMRFDPGGSNSTAAEILNQSPEQELIKILEEYGEEQFAHEIASAIIQVRQEKPITTTTELVHLIKRAVPAWYTHRKIHAATKTFQALRVAVNQELENIRQGIAAALEVLPPKGRLLVISFQGSEDKIVREFFKQKAKEGIIQWVTRKTIRPTWDEMKDNPRARSAKMKIIEKL